MNNNMEKEIFDIYVDDIIPNRFQPRLTFDDKSLSELADSIKLHGIIQPLVLRKVGDKYEIIAGERRYKAAQIAGLQKVPAVIMNLNDNESAEVAVIENIQRKDLTALEEAESYKKLLDRGYLTQEQLASRMGKAQATISNKLRLLNLNQEVKDALLNEKISERHARSLLSLKDQAQQKEILDKIINNKLTVRQTDDLIKSMTGNNTVEILDFSDGVPTNLPPTPQSIDSPSISPISNPTVQPFTPVNEPIVSTAIPFIDDQPNNFPPLPSKDALPDSARSEEVPSGFNPISNIDVNQIKEQAVDINPTDQLADVNALLGIKDGIVPSQVEQPITPITASESEKPRFITSLEDEETNMDMNEPVPSSIPSIMNSGVNPLNQQNPVTTQSEPKTYTDSLVQEFRQTNGMSSDGNIIISGDLRSAINAVRDLTRNLERNNFNVDVEEFDFEKLYQIIIKINK